MLCIFIAQYVYIQADAALQRSKQFNQGGGGDKLKAKAKAREDYEKRNTMLGGDSGTGLKWTV